MSFLEQMCSYADPSSAYLAVLEDVLQSPDFRSAPRGLAIREKLHYQFTVSNPVSTPIVTRSVARNETIAAYTKAEFDLYARGVRDTESFGKASSFWTKLGNPDGTINSAYGHLIFFDKSCGDPLLEDWYNKPKNPMFRHIRTPWEWARLALMSDKDTRQAILKFHRRNHLWVGNNDQVCTVYGSFLIRVDQLHLIIHMRSNDLVKGLVYDLPWFCYLMERMTAELRQNVYPDLRLGTYTHVADSSHIYDADLPKVWEMIGLSP